MTKGRVPGWTVPVAAGLAMIGYTIWSEYSWYARMTDSLPETVHILSAPEKRSPLRPWTYLAPLRDRFLALDTADVKRNPAVPGQRLARIMVVARYGAQGRLPVLVDCETRQRADLADGASFAADGTVEGADWRVVDAEDPVLRILCGKG